LFFAGEKNIVKNDFKFSPKENLYILTGPNRGGKTIIEQALGIISVMASIGSFVTASGCMGRPFTNILTHFPIDENLTINYGRLGEEAVRIRDMVAKADNRTLILLNETYSTTSVTDGLYLSMDLLRVLKELGTAVIFNTHIHELAMNIEELNRLEGESNVVSIVMEIIDNVNTFKVKRSAPQLKSYAKNIAEKYGITYEQMRNDRINGKN
jgi:DNA mismatch repair ATPase MutS